MEAKDIERRMDEIVGEMRGIGDMLFGSVTTNRNRKLRKRKEGVYVSPPHYTFNSTGENGRKLCKRIRPENVQRVRNLMEAGRRWKGLEKEYERLANQLEWAGGAKKTSVAAAETAEN